MATVVSLAIWAFNFYGILSWLQPLLIGGDPGNWITNPKYLPWWVAAATHLVFGWTIALLYPWGEYTPYRRTKDTEHGVIRTNWRFNRSERKKPWSRNCLATKNWSMNDWSSGTSLLL